MHMKLRIYTATNWFGVTEVLGYDHAKKTVTVLSDDNGGKPFVVEVDMSREGTRIV